MRLSLIARGRRYDAQTCVARSEATANNYSCEKSPSRFWPRRGGAEISYLAGMYPDLPSAIIKRERGLCERAERAFSHLDCQDKLLKKMKVQKAAIETNKSVSFKEEERRQEINSHQHTCYHRMMLGFDINCCDSDSWVDAVAYDAKNEPSLNQARHLCIT